jgi:phosphatidylserine synthase
MLPAAIILSVVFTSLGFVVTSGNAKYILSGYNTMSEADRAKMDIEGYLRFFKGFHIALGTTLIAGYLILSFININWAGIFMIMYPLLAYVFLIAKGNQFYKGSKGQKVGTYIGMAIIVVVAVAVGIQLHSSFRNSEINLSADVLEIKGIYGFKLKKEDVSEITIVPEIPSISFKSNGFSAGDFSKGSFKTIGWQDCQTFYQ